MGQFIELGTGKTRYFDNLIDFINATEDNGFQNLIADNIGSYIDGFKPPSSSDEEEIQKLLEEYDNSPKKSSFRI